MNTPIGDRLFQDIPCRAEVSRKSAQGRRKIGGRKVWLTTTTRVPCINAAMMRNPLKLARVSQTNETISATSGPKFTKLCGHVEEILLLDKFFPIVDTCLSCKDIAPQICGMVPRWLLHAVFSASRAQHVSDLHSKFTPRPHHVWRYGRHPISDC